MSTFLGKVFRGVVYSVTSPVTAITGKQIAKNYVGDTSNLITTKAQNWFTDFIGVKKDSTVTTTGTTTAPTTTTDIKQIVQTQLQDSITNLFSGVAEKAGASAGKAAGDAAGTILPKWLWPLVAIIGITGLVVLLVKLFKKKGRRK